MKIVIIGDIEDKADRPQRSRVRRTCTSCHMMHGVSSSTTVLVVFAKSIPIVNDQVGSVAGPAGLVIRGCLRVIARDYRLKL